MLGSGTFDTKAFNLQKGDELRWYFWYRTIQPYSISHHTDMIINKQESVTLYEDIQSRNYYGEIKNINNSNVLWAISMSLDDETKISNVARNGLTINLNDGFSDSSTGSPYWKTYQPTEDGLFWLGNSFQSFGHYSYATQQWKSNNFRNMGVNFCVAQRYNGRSYVVGFNTVDGGMSLLTETDSVVHTTDAYGVPVAYCPMKKLADLPIVISAGGASHSAIFGDNIFILSPINGGNGNYVVLKINLTNPTITIVQSQSNVSSNTLGGTTILYNNTNLAIDEAGNFYAVESRSENATAHFSIRKYNANGTNEVILKESDLIEYAQIEAIKWFNNKLYVAVKYREETNNDNTENYHMQIISPK
ncbi:MAG: hypothetical protein H6553_03225 [Chitinophagales bacterium]|nr:hypothetical protein [Chitinophagales bacterium]